MAGIHRRALLGAAAAALVTYPNVSPANVSPARARACLDELLGRRQMVRRFRADPVPDEVVERLVRAARRAPSAGHTQPWAFVVVRDTGKRKALAKAALGQRFIAEAPVVIVACADRARSQQRYGEEGDYYAVLDTGFASLFLLLAVVEEGLGACFVGALDAAEVSRLLELPPPVRPIAVIPVGVPAERPRAMKLRRTEEILHRERW